MAIGSANKTALVVMKLNIIMSGLFQMEADLCDEEIFASSFKGILSEIG